MRDQRARLFAQHGRPARGHQPHERVLRQIGRVAAVAQLAMEPALQPAVVMAIKLLDHGERKGVGRLQDAQQSTECE
ncbi:hypothetical protein D3C78_1910820 [compost metagenome]